ncbi:hypothetical protein EIN_025150, partial [Entamoeba invadens IP1]|uniref:hypothetical protein n=1 Tax=Entamoeba invadens IP1 TaxID=370355 RepID=UPI0002C3E743
MSKCEEELQVMLLQYVREKYGQKAFTQISAELKIFLDTTHVFNLVDTDKLEELDEYLSSFVDLKNNNDTTLLYLIRRYLILRYAQMHDYVEGKKYYTKLSQLPQFEKEVTDKTILSSIFFDPTLCETEIKKMGNLEEYRKTKLRLQISDLINTSENLKKYLSIANVDGKLIKRLVSDGVRYRHVKVCHGSPSDDISLLSLISGEHIHKNENKPVYTSSWKCSPIDVLGKSTTFELSDSILFIGMKNMRMVIVHLSRGEVICDLKVAAPILKFAVSVPFFATLSETSLSVMSLCCSGISELCRLTCHGVTGVEFIKGTSHIAYVENTILRIYDFILKKEIFTHQNVIGVIPQTKNGTIVAVLKSDMVLIGSQFSQPY